VDQISSPRTATGISTRNWQLIQKSACVTLKTDQNTAMTIDVWLAMALADSERRNLPDLKPLLEALARSLVALRSADFNDRADDDRPRPAHD
jgi:hypothetical protein